MPRGNDEGILLAIYDGKAYEIGTKKTFEAIELLPHGRLIDADALGITDFELVLCRGEYKELAKLILEKIENAPTVIGADESHNERYDFLEFLWNTINPNEMQEYWTMFHCKNVPTDGKADEGE